MRCSRKDRSKGHRRPQLTAVGVLVALVTGCSSADDLALEPPPAGELPRDALPDGLYHDFFDGKFDAAGHPLNAQVWEAEDASCNGRTGWREQEGQGLWANWDPADVVCQASSALLGRGRFTLNVRALVYEACADESCAGDTTVLTLLVRDAAGQVIQSIDVSHDAFLTANTYQNVPLTFSHTENEPVSFEVSWPGHVGARVDYVELFRSHRNLLVTPPSGPWAAGDELQIELQDPPADYHLEIRCDELELTDRLNELLTAGEATSTQTEFRTIVTAPAATLLEGCTLPTRVRVSVVSGTWVRATSRVTVLDQEPPCDFASDATRVLLTGFEPFPADSNRDNSSEQAVTGFDAGALDDVSVMTMVLPVEFDTAPDMLASAIARCEPDVVIGFGQGRTEVDLETTAYNLKDSSAIAGGVPDNRGLIGEGDAIEPGSDAELDSGLPLERIRAEIAGAGIAVNLSDDPGRYVCNNLFYRIMTATSGTAAVGGFVHLPRIGHVTDADRAMLQTVVEHVVGEAVAVARDGP